MTQDAAADVDRLTDLALALPPGARELVAYRIWESLQSGEPFRDGAAAPDPRSKSRAPAEPWPLTREQTDEIQRRLAQGDSVECVDGDEVVRKARARIDARRR